MSVAKKIIAFCEAERFQVGDEVRYCSVEHGWQFGEVIGTHRDTEGSDATGIAMATVRFVPYERLGLPARDCALPQFQLELCSFDPRACEGCTVVFKPRNSQQTYCRSCRGE